MISFSDDAYFFPHQGVKDKKRRKDLPEKAKLLAEVKNMNVFRDVAVPFFGRGQCYNINMSETLRQKRKFRFEKYIIAQTIRERARQQYKIAVIHICAKLDNFRLMTGKDWGLS
jgi:hypothetical protein